MFPVPLFAVRGVVMNANPCCNSPLVAEMKEYPIKSWKMIHSGVRSTQDPWNSRIDQTGRHYKFLIITTTIHQAMDFMLVCEV